MKPSKIFFCLAIFLVTGNSYAKKVAPRLREDILRNAKVWEQPQIPISEANLAKTPVGENGFEPEAVVECDFVNKTSSGQTAKFFCAITRDDEIKVKPSAPYSEHRTETAASRLLAALGFGADRMYMVKQVLCKGGCPDLPFPTVWWFSMYFTVPSEEPNSFEKAAIERKFGGTSVETETIDGWSMDELKKITAGSSRAEIDALRLMAVFLGHWDNKAENQRLVCLDETFKTNPTFCQRPFALLQDVGATFGKHARKDIAKWSAHKIWADAKTCTVSMKTLPFQGATFADTVISEEGRLFLSGLLKQLSRKQITDLFTSTYFERNAKGNAKWVDAFEDKVKQIADRAPCPAL